MKEKKERKSDSLCLCCTNKKSGGVHVESGETLKTLFFLLFFFFSSVYERGRDAAKQNKRKKVSRVLRPRQYRDHLCKSKKKTVEREREQRKDNIAVYRYC